jgi:hypothetical protein
MEMRTVRSLSCAATSTEVSTGANLQALEKVRHHLHEPETVDIDDGVAAAFNYRQANTVLVRIGLIVVDRLLDQRHENVAFRLTL